jgi:hypothetical protein
MQFSIVLEPLVADFYQKIAQNSGKPLEQVLEDALFRLAGELSVQAVRSS